MNKKQKIILCVGLVLFVLMGLFPSWIEQHPTRYGIQSKDLGHWPILMPPEPSISTYHRVEINFSRLVVQWTVVMIATSGLIVLCADKKDK